MKTPQIAALIAIILSPLVCAGQARATDILAVGGWSATAQIIGTEIVSTYESATNATLLTIADAPGAWSVDVRRTDHLWDPGLVLSLRRTGNGSGGSGGSGGISGGTRYQEITPTGASFIQGARNRFDIPIQMRISGVSVDIPAGTYSTTITYTVVDN